MEISNAGDLKKYLEDLLYEYDTEGVRTLDEYLRALLGALYHYKDAEPAYASFGELFKSGFDAVPLQFHLSWMNLKALPFVHFEPNPDDIDNTLIDPQTKKTVTKFEVLEKTIMFQIADLRRMEEESGEIISSDDDMESTDPMKEIEVSQWANFDTVSYLTAIMCWIYNEHETECDWLTLTDLLEYGRTAGAYEE